MSKPGLGLRDGEILRIRVFSDGSFDYEQREEDGRVSFGWSERFGDDARNSITLSEFLPHLRAWVNAHVGPEVAAPEEEQEKGWHGRLRGTFRKRSDGKLPT